MEDKRLIGYKPNLQYTDEYVSDASGFFNDDNSGQEDADNNDDLIADLIDQMEVIDSLIDKLPGGANGTIGEVFDQILDFVDEELKDKEYDRVPEEIEWNYETPDKEPDFDNDESDNPDKDGDFNEDDFWDDVDNFPIQKEEHTKTEVIEKEYIKNLVDLFDDYFTNLHTILSNYWTNLMGAVFNKETNEIAMLVDNILLNSSDIKPEARHLLDSAIRGQITRTMKLDFFNNIFNAEYTITHLKQFKAMYELRLRYAEIDKQNGSEKTNQMNNNILEGLELTYDKKYDIAYENLYRYLKSSNEVLDDTLKTWITEIKSKQVLIERKGVK